MEMQLNGIEQVTEVDHLIAMAEGRGRSRYSGALKPIQVRVPVHTWAILSALAEQADTSRNVVVFKMIDAALEKVSEGLTDVARGRLLELQAKYVAEALGEGLESGDL